MIYTWLADLNLCPSGYESKVSERLEAVLIEFNIDLYSNLLAFHEFVAVVKITNNPDLRPP